MFDFLRLLPIILSAAILRADTLTRRVDSMAGVKARLRRAAARKAAEFAALKRRKRSGERSLALTSETKDARKAYLEAKGNAFKASGRLEKAKLAAGNNGRPNTDAVRFLLSDGAAFYAALEQAAGGASRAYCRKTGIVLSEKDIVSAAVFALCEGRGVAMVKPETSLADWCRYLAAIGTHDLANAYRRRGEGYQDDRPSRPFVNPVFARLREAGFSGVELSEATDLVLFGVDRLDPDRRKYYRAEKLREKIRHRLSAN